MWLAEETVPKINSADCGEDGGLGGLSFCPLENAVENAIPRFAGKILFVSDAHTLNRFAPFARGARAMSVVTETDALPLFTMPDSVSAVFAAGGEVTIRSARFFAEVRRIPCLLFPSNAALFGVYEQTGTVWLCGEKSRVNLKDGEVYFDLSLLQPSLAEGYAALLLSRLALVEEHALRVFSRGEKRDTYEKAYAAIEPVTGVTEKEIVTRNATLRQLERLGAPAGEGRTLARLHEAAGDTVPAWRAFCALAALYSAFFECGKPRSFVVPDYSMRANRAGTEYFHCIIPTCGEYAKRAVTLERMRGAFCTEMNSILRRKGTFVRTFRSLGGETPNVSSALLKTLPEHCPAGLSAVIRDFGLMEF